MKTRRITLSVLILVGLLSGMAVPVARAQTPSPITFHVESSVNIDGSLADSIGTISFEGSWFVGNGHESNGLAVSLLNQCTGTDCYKQDVYYRFETSYSWYTWWYSEATWDHTDLRVSLQSNYGHFTAHPFHTQDYTSETSAPCGVIYTGAGGPCENLIEGHINGSEILQSDGIGSIFFNMNGYNALAGWDMMADYKLTFSTSPIVEDVPECSGQYNIGGAIGSYTIPATDSVGVSMARILGASAPAIGKWFVVQISGAWKENGAGPDLRSAGIKLNGTWYPLGTDPSAECTSLATSVDTYYLQMSGSAISTLIRVYDTDANFGTNTGSITISFSTVAVRTRYASGCELQFQDGTFIEQKTVDAAWPYGWPMAGPVTTAWNPTPGGEMRYYVLETIGGPANLGSGGTTYDADLALRASADDKAPSTWYDIATAPFVTCVVSTDMLGHVKVYFAMDAKLLGGVIEKYFYSFRVQDAGSYSDNSGSLTYRLSQATYLQMSTPGATPGVAGCDRYTHSATPTASLVLQGTAWTGTAVTGLVTGTRYAVEVVDGPWKDNGADKYTVEISDDNGSTWTNLKDFANLLCAASADGDRITIYITAAKGQTWKLRVDDTDGNWGNNSESIGVDIYASATEPVSFPTCEDDYTFSSVNLGGKTRLVPGNAEAGAALQVNAGYTYAIEITNNSKWYESSGAGSYMVDISDDGGQTWVHLEDYPSLCVLQVGDGDRYRVLFNAVAGNAVEGATTGYRLRVRDGDGNFLTNTGWIVYDLYTAKDTTVTPGAGDTGDPSPEWVVACNEAYARPDGWITWYGIVPVPRVGEWIDYLRSAITFYFAWCPQHTEALKSMSDVYLDKEPLASILGVRDFVKNIQVSLESYRVVGGDMMDAGMVSQEPALFSDSNNIGGSGGADYTAPSSNGPWDLFLVESFNPSTSIWYGGELDMASSLGSSDLTVMDTYQGLCTNKFLPLFGIGSDPFCSLMAMMRYSSIVTMLLLGIDLFVVIWWFFRYVPGYLKRFWNLITGNKSIVRKVV
jgi:hypothetical protein